MQEFIIASGLSAIATGIGAIPAILFRHTTHHGKDVLLAFSAGMMMAASTFELIPESLNLGGYEAAIIGIFLGMLTLTLLEQNIPHEHIERGNVSSGRTIHMVDRKALLIIIAITLHNIPEGLSVGVSYNSGVEGLGLLIALAIGVQNAPEGFIIAFFLIEQGVKKTHAFLIAFTTGLMEWAAAFIGYWLTAFASQLVPIGLAFAAGSMLYIVYKELIPESHGDGYALSATYSFTGGLLLMVAMTWFF
ncbi:zinc transporter, ZIP family [Alteribacillus persepolensis]|uniref:Zinc transporter, ZIP family n=1 Tax=Alteribacillus persepolensis TaxID=568899 RepID=A0A1G7Z7Q8_9BACI|nr:ZIP family metal transporter [Alteribacillus persepolensis]SDH04783.1 zinc transporter, ZIP family [Alteribacillus persepolensis]